MSEARSYLLHSIHGCCFFVFFFQVNIQINEGIDGWNSRVTESVNQITNKSASRQCSSTISNSKILSSLRVGQFDIVKSHRIVHFAYFWWSLLEPHWCCPTFPLSASRQNSRRQGASPVCPVPSFCWPHMAGWVPWGPPWAAMWMETGSLHKAASALPSAPSRFPGPTDLQIYPNLLKFVKEWSICFFNCRCQFSYSYSWTLNFPHTQETHSLLPPRTFCKINWSFRWVFQLYAYFTWHHVCVLSKL